MSSREGTKTRRSQEATARLIRSTMLRMATMKKKRPGTRRRMVITSSHGSRKFKTGWNPRPPPARKDYYFTQTGWEPPISPEEFNHLYQHAASRAALFGFWPSTPVAAGAGAAATTILPLASPDDEDDDRDIPTCAVVETSL